MVRKLRVCRWSPIGMAGAAMALVTTSAAPDLSAQAWDEPIEARVWLDRGASPVLQRGDRVRLYYRASADAYLAIFHIDTDGIVRLLHPRVPHEDHYVRGNRDYRLQFRRSSYWNVDDQPGVGYFFVVASSRPLDFGSFLYSQVSGGWDLSRVGSHVYGDPYVAMDDYVAALVPDWQAGGYALDFVEYHVGRSFGYPRFVCYDCHAFRPYYSWNPYRYACHSFRIVIHTDPYYYPSYRYRGTRVVYARPPLPQQPRFVFKERAAGEPSTPIFQRRAASDVPGVQGTERRRSPDRPSQVLAPSRGGTTGAPGAQSAPATRRVAPEARRDAGAAAGRSPTSQQRAPGADRAPRPTLERREVPARGSSDRPSREPDVREPSGSAGSSRAPSGTPRPPSSPGPRGGAAAPSSRGGSAPSARGSEPASRTPTPSARGNRPSSRSPAPSARGGRSSSPAPSARGSRPSSRGSTPSARGSSPSRSDAPSPRAAPRRLNGPSGRGGGRAGRG